VANFLKLIFNKATKTIQGINDSNENTMPTTPAEEGTIINKPEANPQSPTDFLNLRLFINATEKRNRQTALNV